MSSGEKIGCWRGGTVGLGWCTFHAVESADERGRKNLLDVAMIVFLINDVEYPYVLHVT